MLLHRKDSVGSTSDEARQLAAAGAPHGTAVLALEQTAGRGRQGRVWISPPGNLHLSVVLRPGVAQRRLPELSLVAAVAVADAVDSLLGQAAARLKWPNDVLVAGAKLAGLLLERFDDAVILGVGMNLAHSPPDLPYPVTALTSCGVSTEPEAAAAAVLAGLDARLDEWQRQGFAATITAWMQRGPGLGAAVQARQGTTWISGSFAGLDGDGALLLDGPSGRQRIIAGEVL